MFLLLIHGFISRDEPEPVDAQIQVLLVVRLRGLPAELHCI